MDNGEKYTTYALLKSKLSRALKGGFWLEACMIEYAIIEDRTSSILQHGGVCKDAYSSAKKLSNKLNSIAMQIGKKHPILSKKVDPNLLESVRVWKDKRNDLVHRACVHYDEAAAKLLAEEGRLLVEKISNDSRKVSRMAQKLYSEER